MNNPARAIVRAGDRLRLLRRAVPLHDAIRILRANRFAGETRVYLKGIERYVTLRNGTTDLNCLEKVFIDGEYELPFELSPRFIVDAGANVGMATLYFAHRYPNAKVVAIEPEQSNFKMLERNCMGLPNVTLVQAALWPRNCDLVIEDTAVEAWMFRVAERASCRNGVSVMAITIQEIMNRFDAHRIDFLKLDIEGAESKLFSDGAELWIDQVSSIAIELHDRYVPGCAQAFYSQITRRKIRQEVRGENVFIKFLEP